MFFKLCIATPLWVVINFQGRRTIIWFGACNPQFFFVKKRSERKFFIYLLLTRLINLAFPQKRYQYTVVFIDSSPRNNLHNFYLNWRKRNKTLGVKSKMKENRRDELQTQKRLILQLKMTNLKQNLTSILTAF